MKNYIAPKSTLLALNLAENIARSTGDTHLTLRYDTNTGLIINTVMPAETPRMAVAKVLAWIREHSNDTTINDCY